jgi:hypothetical protein
MTCLDWGSAGAAGVSGVSTSAIVMVAKQVSLSVCVLKFQGECWWGG